MMTVDEHIAAAEELLVRAPDFEHPASVDAYMAIVDRHIELAKLLMNWNS